MHGMLDMIFGSLQLNVNVVVTLGRGPGTTSLDECRRERISNEFTVQQGTTVVVVVRQLDVGFAFGRIGIIGISNGLIIQLKFDLDDRISLYMTVRNKPLKIRQFGRPVEKKCGQWSMACGFFDTVVVVAVLIIDDEESQDPSIR